MITLYDRIEYKLTMDENQMFNGIRFLVKVLYLKNGQNFEKKALDIMKTSIKIHFLLLENFSKKDCIY